MLIKILHILLLCLGLGFGGCDKKQEIATEDALPDTHTLEMSRESMELFNSAKDTAIEIIKETGKYIPTIFINLNGEIVNYNIIPSDIEELVTLSKATLAKQQTEILAFCLAYDAKISGVDNCDRGLFLIVQSNTNPQAAQLLVPYNSENKLFGEPELQDMLPSFLKANSKLDSMITSKVVAHYLVPSFYIISIK